MTFSGTITVLVENSVNRPGLMAEHGLAYWVETKERCILFDTGQSRLWETNAAALGIDPTAVDTVALSHGHYDHTGGLADALNHSSCDVAVYAHLDAFLSKYRRFDGPARDIGLSSGSREALRRPGVSFHPVTAPTEIVPGIFLTGEIPHIHGEELPEAGFFRDAEGVMPDPFTDDQAMYLRTEAGTVVLLGCAHAGVINTLDYIKRLTDGAPLRVVIGGMHMQSASDTRLAWTLDALRTLAVERLYPAHCTGLKAIAAMWNAFPGQCFQCGVGIGMTFGEKEKR